MQFPLKIIPRSTLEIREPLGSGSFGAVSRATWHGTDVAIRELFLKELSDTLRVEFEHEAGIMAQFRHPNIVGLYGIVDEAGHRGLVIEYMPQGSLRRLLENRKQEISWASRWTMAIDIGNGLRCLHDSHIVHRDLNSLNILLTADLHAKIGDFGLARIRLETGSTASTTGKGTVRWCAPESLCSGFNPATSMDVYSYGMVLWEIASGEIPFASTRNETTLTSRIADGEKETIPADCPPFFGEIISQTWLEAQKRPGAEKVVNDLVRTKPPPAPPASLPPEKNDAEKSWHFDPASERRAGAREDGKPYQILKATGKDKQKVVSLYQHHPVPGYHVASVQVIYNRDFNLGFEVQLKKLQQRNGDADFVPTWGKKNEPDWRKATHSKLEELARPHADPAYPAVKLLPLWHGTRRDKLDSIFRIGYANLATTDSGFFGKGLYGAHEVEYVWRVYGPGNGKKFKTPAEGALILNWVASYSAYPVIDGDLPKIQGKGNYGNYDANFIPVVPRDPLSLNEVSYFPCQPGRQNVYTELVTFESASCLPRYLVELQPDLVKSPVVLPPAIPPVPPPPGEHDFRTGMVHYRASQHRQALPCFEQSAASTYPPACLYLYLIYRHGLGVSIDKTKSGLWSQHVARHAAWFTEQAETGKAEAQLNLGLCYEYKVGVKKDMTLAVSYYKLAAEQGYADAQFRLGVCYYHGKGVNMDLTLAVKYWQLAADQGNADAQKEMGDCYCDGIGVEEDKILAVKYYHLAADQEQAVAQLVLANCYFFGQGVKADGTLAVKYWQLAADQGDAVGQFKLGACYHYGLSVERDNILAIRYYQLAANQGEARAQFRLGNCYYKGKKGVEKDLPMALKYYQLAADQGDAWAQLMLGRCYYNGEVVKKDLTRAVRYYQLAADQGDARAQHNLGNCYYSGEGVNMDVTLAVKYWQLAADQGNAEAQNTLGDCYNLIDSYKKGYYVKMDLTQAVKYYQLAADQGNADAQANLGDCYYYERGVEKDLTQAVRYYQLAADQGNADAQAKLGDWYYYERGVEKDNILAVKYYQLAADQGDADAQHKLGLCYEYGQGVTQNLSQAIDNYQLAAEQGKADAQHNLGNFYYIGEAVKQDVTQAVKYWQLAADQGHADAQHNLGYCYFHGEGVKEDLPQAVRYYQLAADQGDARAQHNLGNCYYYGNGVKKDLTEAAKYYQLAADQGHTDAQRNLQSAQVWQNVENCVIN